MADLNVMQAYQNSSDLSKLDRTSKSLREETQAADTEIRSNRTNDVQEASSQQVSSTQAKQQTIVDSQEVDALMENLNQQLQTLQNYLRFEKDDDSQKMVIFIKDSETDEIIRQIPAKELLEVSKNITKFLETHQTLNQAQSGSSSPIGLLTNQTA
ncbi:flagellar protein FlaG [Thiomicrorhabdus sp. 6S2-11]|uniref:Flagellar protein FlaG n=1 Tax=Thiomicrorhabdus marina TaxID=2818442 RepID=A0ABS3Q7P9_9GAMM|nr:flagellar protein FlaG [Thiomicrorhabdus marina]MBO1928385.1 flagellar protein FlaG [Thiomicrorhabdus marina]